MHIPISQQPRLSLSIAFACSIASLNSRFSTGSRIQKLYEDTLWKSSMQVRWKLRSDFETNHNVLRTDSGFATSGFADRLISDPTVNRSWLCQFVSKHVKQAAFQESVFQIMVAVQDYPHHVSPESDWHHLRHHAGSILYEVMRTHGLHIHEMLTIHKKSMMYVLTNEGIQHKERLLWEQGQIQDTIFNAIPHGMLWQSAIDAARFVVRSAFWTWHEEHLPLLQSHALGHGVFFFSLMNDAAWSKSPFSVCYPFRPHSLLLDDDIAHKALDICREAPTLRLSAGCRDGLAHSWYQWGFGPTGNSVDVVCGAFEDWWCFFWYQASKYKLIDLQTMCSSIHEKRIMDQCVSAVTWSRFPFFDRYLRNGCSDPEVFHPALPHNMYHWPIDASSFPGSLCQTRRLDTLKLWCENEMYNQSRTECLRSGALSAAWYMPEWSELSSMCAVNFEPETKSLTACESVHIQQDEYDLF